MNGIKAVFKEPRVIGALGYAVGFLVAWGFVDEPLAIAVGVAVASISGYAEGMLRAWQIDRKNKG